MYFAMDKMTHQIGNHKPFLVTKNAYKLMNSKNAVA